ncbi:MAG: hypothetical protein ABGY41_16465 [Candidatus Poribacteria bacterium]
MDQLRAQVLLLGAVALAFGIGRAPTGAHAPATRIGAWTLPFATALLALDSTWVMTFKATALAEEAEKSSIMATGFADSLDGVYTALLVALLLLAVDWLALRRHVARPLGRADAVALVLAVTGAALVLTTGTILTGFVQEFARVSFLPDGDPAIAEAVSGSAETLHTAAFRLLLGMAFALLGAAVGLWAGLKAARATSPS